jgi:ABC-type uncharacterized transport system involved in gliding motility auxiliary subunit
MSSVRQKMAAVQKAQNKQFEAEKRGFLPLQEPTATLKPLVDEVEEVALEVALEVEETTPAPKKPKTEKTKKTAKTKKPAPKGKKS